VYNYVATRQSAAADGVLLALTYRLVITPWVELPMTRTQILMERLLGQITDLAVHLTRSHWFESESKQTELPLCALSYETPPFARRKEPPREETQAKRYCG